MLINVSYKNTKQTKQVIAIVGAPFSLRERWKMKGIGSPKLKIKEASGEISQLLALDNTTNSCNIELRPKGIILRFRSLLETYALIIPYYKLHVYKGEAAVYSIYRDQYFVKVNVDRPSVNLFLKKVLQARARLIPETVENSTT